MQSSNAIYLGVGRFQYVLYVYVLNFSFDLQLLQCCFSYLYALWNRSVILYDYHTYIGSFNISCLTYFLISLKNLCLEKIHETGQTNSHLTITASHKNPLIKM